MPTPEGELKTAVAKYLKKIEGRALVIRLQSGVVRKGSRFIHLCDEGTADYLICDPGPAWVELKPPGKDGTSKARKALQAAFAEKVVGLGHRHATVRSVDELIAFLEADSGASMQS